MSLQPVKLTKGITKENVLMALSNLRANKFRSFLTTLGIVIGVATVIVIASLLTGMRKNIVTLIEEYGTNNIWAFHLTTGFQFGPTISSHQVSRSFTIRVRVCHLESH